MTKTIVLHIGANKTGSSAIQALLKQNAAILAKFGFTVAAADLTRQGAVTGYHVWYLQSLLDDVQDGKKKLTEKVETLMADLAEGSKLVLSAENLANRNNSHLLFSELSSRYDIEVILYVRRQDEFLLSAWQQWHGKNSDDFWAWLVSVVGQYGNWQACLQAWETVTPRNKIKTRIYERKLLVDRDVNADFIEQLGLAPHRSEFVIPDGIVNPSFTEAVFDLVKGSKLIFDGVHDNGFFNLVQELTGDAFFKKPGESPITLNQRLAIIRRYGGPNAWVKDNYFPGVKGELFTPPAEGDYKLLSRDGIEAEKWRLAASLIYGLSRRGAKDKGKKA